MPRRAQSFHKSFLTAEFRAQNARRWAAEWSSLDGPELCAQVIVSVHRDLFGKHWRNGRRELSPLYPAGASGSALDTLANFRIRSLPETAALGLLRWARGEIQLKIFRGLPSVQEILRLQTNGIRCVSVLVREDEILNFSHEERDFFSFLIHDLIHAQLMTADHESFQNQIKFARWLQSEWTELSRDLSEPAARELDYMAADMNSHLVHLLKTFKSWVERHRPALLERSDWFFHGPWKRLNRVHGEEAEAVHRELVGLWQSYTAVSHFNKLAP